MNERKSIFDPALSFEEGLATAFMSSAPSREPADELERLERRRQYQCWRNLSPEDKAEWHGTNFSELGNAAIALRGEERLKEYALRRLASYILFFEQVRARESEIMDRYEYVWNSRLEGMRNPAEKRFWWGRAKVKEPWGTDSFKEQFGLIQDDIFQDKAFQDDIIQDDVI